MITTLTKTVAKTKLLIPRIARKVVTHPGEALLLCRMAWWVSVLSVVARCYSLPRALRLVAGRASHRQIAADGVQDQLARAIDLLLSADVLVFKPVCWKRAAVLHRYLLKNGIATRIIFGVRNNGEGNIDGHAWLELRGQPIFENPAPEYVVTYSFPSNQRFDSQLPIFSHE
jgi:Transglutaminase-like superfamily